MTDRTKGDEPERILWSESGAQPRHRPALERDLDVDVVIVGAGYTGLWTAYYLRRADPNVRLAVIDQAHVGFGASGRNGGWCSAIFPVGPRKLVRMHGHEQATALRLAMQQAVDEVGAVAVSEEMPIDFAKGGCMDLVRNPAQLTRARADVESARGYGIEAEDLRFLSGEEARSITGAQDVLGAIYTPHCAAVHPGRLVRQLAERVERGGVAIYERTAARSLAPRMVVTDRGRIRAELIVRATEGYTSAAAGVAGSLLPIYSLMIATEPLPDAAWDEIGLRGPRDVHRPSASADLWPADCRRPTGIRGSRCALSLRIGDTARVRHGRANPRGPGEPSGGAVPGRGWTRDHPCVGRAARDRARLAPVGRARSSDGIAWAGGYVGDGVATTNLAGRTLTDLILGRKSDLTALPWVNHRSRRWEPEPFRWLGVNAGLQLVATADREEARSGKPARRARTLARVLGY